MRFFFALTMIFFLVSCKSTQPDLVKDPISEEAEQLRREGVDSRCYFGCLKRNRKMAMGIEQIKTECRNSCFIDNKTVILPQ